MMNTSAGAGSSAAVRLPDWTADLTRMSRSGSRDVDLAAVDRLDDSLVDVDAE